ncbi:MAG: 3-deoxy-manno-octulosonate cytidylyltransferase [Planctomycetota bacterium]
MDGLPVIVHVFRNALRSRLADTVIVATDDYDIHKAVLENGGVAVMTSPAHPSGSDRVAEAVASIEECEFIVNIQGDEPRIPPSLVDAVFGELERGEQVVTAARALRNPGELSDPSRVKVVLDCHSRALLFSRSAIPFARDEQEKPLQLSTARIHVGLYGFRRSVLLNFPAMPRPAIEELEKLEQLRLVYAGIPIKVLDCGDFGDSIDTREDLESFIRAVQNREDADIPRRSS